MLCACVGVPPQHLSSFNKAALPDTCFNKPEFISHINDTEGKKRISIKEIEKENQCPVDNFTAYLAFIWLTISSMLYHLENVTFSLHNIYSSEHVIYFLHDQYPYNLQGIYITRGLDFVCKRDCLRPRVCSAATYSCSHRVIVSKTEGNTKLHSSRS